MEKSHYQKKWLQFSKADTKIRPKIIIFLYTSKDCVETGSWKTILYNHLKKTVHTNLIKNCIGPIIEICKTVIKQIKKYLNVETYYIHELEDSTEYGS